MQLRKLIALCLIPILLCGCQSAPDENVVISKNDGSFDINVIQSATKPSEVLSESSATYPSNEAPFSQAIQYTDTFFSTDDTVQFTLTIDNEVTNSSMPVVEVSPHFLTEEDAKRVAYVLFGERDYYEAEPRFAPVYSKADILEKLARWAPYGGDPSVDSYIKKYTVLLESAPADNPHMPCQWEYKKETFYYESPDNASAADTSNDNDDIRASVKVNGIPYIYDVATRNRTDFKLNNIYAYPYDGLSPRSIDYQIFQHQLCQTDKPDAKTIAAVQEKAETMLEQMELGEWVVDECSLETVDYYDVPEYIIHVNAVPAFQGVAASRKPQLTNLKSTSAYASNYYLTDVQLALNANGDIVNFSLYSPVDVKEIINEDVQVLPMDEVIQLAKKQFTLSDYYEYDHLKLIESIQEELSCQVEIGYIDYGLTRVKVPNTDESYYYVPAVVFYGNIQFCGKGTGNIYDVEAPYEWGFPLLTLNAIDGTVINSTNQ